MRDLKAVLVWLPILFLSGCGGSDGGSTGSTVIPPTTSPNVEVKDGRMSGGLKGASFASGDTTGELDADGNFRYEVIDGVTQDVAFSVGGVEFSSILGREYLTILDLVTGANTSNQELQNIIRFLLLLDEDQNPANGLSVSAALLSYLEIVIWPAIDFSDADFDNQIALNDIIMELRTVEGDGRMLPESSAVAAHLLGNYYCNASGVYNVNFSGDDSGTFVVAIEPFLGTVGAWGYSSIDQLLLGIPFFQGEAVSPDNGGGFIAGDVSSGAYFSGNLEGFENISGSWNNDTFGESGTFSGSKAVASDEDYARMFIIYADSIVDPFSQPPENFGVVALSVDRLDNFAALSIDAAGVETELTGTLTSNTLNLGSSDGSLSLEGILYRDSDEDPNSVGPNFEGVWGNSNTGLNVNAAGVGCNL